MNVLLILLGIYVYFVAGELTYRGLARLFPKSVKITRESNPFNLLMFPMGVIIVLIVAKFDENELKFPALPKFNIPFTPKKVADLICSIRIERKAEKPGCFGSLLDERQFYENGCIECKFGPECRTEFQRSK